MRCDYIPRIGPSPSSVHAPTAGASARDRRRALLAVALWLALVLGARYWADAMQDAGRVIRLKAPPLAGFDIVRITWRNLAPVVVGAALVTSLPRLARELTWRLTLALTAGASLAWSISLAVIDGWSGLTQGVHWRSDEYIHEVAGIDSPADFVSGFTDNIGDYVTHVRSHPPGLVLILWVMDHLGLGGFGWNAALYLAGGCVALVAVLIAVREVVDEMSARRAVPFLVVTPAAIWIATTAEAFYAGVGAWAVTLVVLASGRRGPTSTFLALGGGLLFGALAYMSYGHLLLALIPSAVAVQRRRGDVLGLALIGALPVALAFTAAGFWWFDGLTATRLEYGESVARDRPYGPFLLFNAAAFAIALGPATLAALVSLRDRRLWLLVGAALAAVGLAALVGLSKGEVERIWLPFTIWVLPACVALVPPDHADRTTRGWLGLQGTTAVIVQSLLKPRW